MTIEEAFRFIDEFMKELDNEVKRWIPVEDALPEENIRCIVYTEGGGYGISRRMGRNLEKWNCFGLQVTHWMPLPEPPEKE